MTPLPSPHLRRLGLQPYHTTWRAMQQFTATATAHTAEELWLLQHPPVYTLGRAAKREHLIAPPAHIPIIPSDRGGQVTYHGPGQLVAYLMLHLPRRGLGLRRLVRALETAVINFMATYGIQAAGDPTAPGVYIDGAKLAALGLRLRRGWTSHGIALNIHMDLTPFAGINPCGTPNLPITQMSAHCRPPPLAECETQLARHLAAALAQATQPPPPSPA